MNILVACISTFSFTKTIHSYKVCIENCSEKEVSAYHTNESVVKLVSNLDAIKQSGGLNKIIALVSDAVKTTKSEAYGNVTALEYYKKIVKELNPNTEVVPISTESDGQMLNIPFIVNQICYKIDKDDKVYIDSAGGQRTMINLIQILVKILQYKGIQNPYNIYSDIGGQIRDTKEFVEMSTLADSMNEFMMTGKVTQLKEFFRENKNPPEYTRLIDAMEIFSDCIRLGNVDSLGDVVKTLDSCIIDCQELSLASDAGIGPVVLRQFLPLIKEELVGDTESGIDYVKLIMWCLKNDLIQQALTIYVEKICVYFFEKKIFNYSADIVKAKTDYKEKRLTNKILPGNWETYAFYEELLNITNKRLIGEFSACLRNGIQSKLPEVQKAVNLVKKITFPLNYSALSKSDSESMSEILNYIKKQNIYNQTSLYSALCNNEALILSILGKESVSRENSYAVKFYNIDELMNCNNIFPYYIDKQNIKPLYYGYIYAKGIRNRVNHASSEEVFTEEQKNILREYEFDFDSFTLNTIKKNLYKALRFINNIVNPRKVVIKVKKAPEVTYSTDLKVGDIVKATCISMDPKLVQIESYDYDIQLVIPQWDSIENYYMKDIKVEIRQISKKQKITQVRLVS